VRVLVVAPWGEALGGAENMLLSLLEAAPASGCEFDVAFLDHGPFVAAAAARGATPFVIEAGRLRHGRRLLTAIRTLRLLVRRRRPDLMLAWSPKMQLYTALARSAASSPLPLMWWQHGTPQPPGWLDRLATILPADAIGCSSEASAAAQRRLRPQRRCLVVHPGVPEPVACDPADTPFGAGDVVIGIVGRLQRWKGQDRFLEAIAMLRDDGLPVKALVVGGDAYGLSPGYADEVRQLVSRLDLDDHVLMTGQVPDAAPYVRAMDVLVNASEDEPFGIVLIEAMACGVPVVAVNRGGPAEILDERSGMLVESGAPKDLADGVRRLLEDDALRSALAAGGRERFREQFSARAMAERFGQQAQSVARA
jgi:glycosyltransferase involved in cell wall biosynthesis